MNESLPNEVYIVESNSGDSWENNPFIVGLRYTHEDAIKLAEEFNKANVESFMDLEMPFEYFQEYACEAMSDEDPDNDSFSWVDSKGYTANQWENMHVLSSVIYEEFTEATITKMDIK